MKKTLLCAIILVVALMGPNSYAQVRLTGVDPASGTVTIKNFGTSSVDISGYRFCHNFNYSNTVANATVLSGTPSSVSAGSTVVLILGAVLNVNGSDLGLYLPGTSNGDFAQASMMVDFLQWVNSGNGRESVAVAKGIWSTGDFIAGVGAYDYIGDGTQNGVAFWNLSTGLNENVNSQNGIVAYPNPVKSELTVEILSNSQTTYSMINILGDIVLEGTTNLSDQRIIIDVSELPKGEYILVLESDNESRAKKITVN